MSEPILTDDEIREVGRNARSAVPCIAGNCRHIATDVQRQMDETYSVHVEVVETQVGEKRDTHYVNKLPARHYADASDPVLIDAALDQFCTENQHREDVRVDFGPRDYLPDVAIYPPGEEERHVWYYTPNDPREGHDVFTDEELSR